MLFLSERCQFLAPCILANAVAARPIGRSNPAAADLDGQIVFGGAYRDRTDDPLLAKQVLSQLS